MPAVSIIIPCFNYGHYLDKALGSVQSQSYQDWECIVVDDGSTDNTRAVAQSFVSTDSRIRYLYQANSGLSAARNQGIRASNGLLVQLLDADDLIESDKLRIQAEFLLENPHVDVVYGDARFFSDEKCAVLTRAAGGVDNDWMPRISGRGEPLLAELLQKNIMVVQAALTRRSVYSRVGMFDESLYSHEDWEFWLRCANAGSSFFYLAARNTSSLVREHPSSMSKRLERMLLTEISVRERYQSLLTAALARQNHEELCQARCWLGVEQIRKGQVRSGIVAILRAVGAARSKLQTLKYLSLLVVPSITIERIRSVLRTGG
jgi:glycosyltransferase involved in cell wall biosynthesis